MKKQPNLIVVITDHQRADSLGMVQCGREVMPRLNRFAEDAAVFNRAYTTAPLCLPARTAMATGVYPTAGLPINDFSGCAARHQILATRFLEEAGYKVAYIGKNDIRTLPAPADQHDNCEWIDKQDYAEWLREQGLPDHPGWEDDEAGFHGYFYKQVEEILPDGPVTSRYSHPATGKWKGKLENFRDFYFYREMRDWLNIRATDEAPFAAFFSIPSPHPPLEVPEPYHSTYDPEKVDLPSNVGVPAEGEPANRNQAVARQLAADASEADHRKAWAAHLGLLSLADDVFGKLLDDLDELELADDTVVIFTSDHGHHLGQHRMFGINELYEQTVHVPLIAKVPGGHTGRVDQLVSHLSIAPTLLELAGLRPSVSMAGPSLLPTLTRGTPPPDAPQFFQFSGQIGYGYFRRGVVTRRFKYIYDPDDEPELYDLENDPLEMHNIARDPDWANVLAEHHALCRDWHLAHGDWVDWDTL
jgi:arylsulfatase A-like enzyme